MDMQLSYFLTQPNRNTAIRGSLARLCEITDLPSDQWEICLTHETQATVDYIQSEFPNTRITRGRTVSNCSGQYVIPLAQNIFPASGGAVSSILSHFDDSSQTGVIIGEFQTPAAPPALPTLIPSGVCAFRRSTLEKAGGLSALRGDAADYDLTFRILATAARIDHRPDILFQSPNDAGNAFAPPERNTPTLREIADRLAVIRRFLPENLSQIYWEDWTGKYKALAANSRGKLAGHLAMLVAKLQSMKIAISTPDPVSLDIFESIFGLRRHAATIGDWARQTSVWRVVLADFSDNLWATYNACRSSGLQMRCVADNHPAYAHRSYRDLPIVPASRAFEGGGIDGVILTSTDPAQIRSSFKSLRNYFPGPILCLCQPPIPAAQAQAA